MGELLVECFLLMCDAVGVGLLLFLAVLCAYLVFALVEFTACFVEEARR